MSVPFIDLAKQYDLIRQPLLDEFDDLFRKSAFILGDDVKDFEEKFSSFCDVRYGVGVNSGTDALYMALSSLGVGKGDEVILPTHTFIATALAVSYTGATPVFADIEDTTYNLDASSVAEKITDKTKAVMPVHIYGQSANMEGIWSLKEKYGFQIVEDAAQAHGAKYKNKKVGSLGDVACFSFYPTKALGAFGDAGMVVTDIEKVYENMLMLRDYGRKDRYTHKTKGHNSRLDTVQAIVLDKKLAYLDEWNKMRRDLAQHYNDRLKDVDVITPSVLDGGEHIYQTYAVRVKNREEVMASMKEKGVGTLIHYPIPVHLQEAYSEFGHKKGDFPVAEQIADEIMSLPIFPYMTIEQVDEVCDALKGSLS